MNNKRKRMTFIPTPLSSKRARQNKIAYTSTRTKRKVGTERSEMQYPEFFYPRNGAERGATHIVTTKFHHTAPPRVRATIYTRNNAAVETNRYRFVITTARSPRKVKGFRVALSPA